MCKKDQSKSVTWETLPHPHQNAWILSKRCTPSSPEPLTLAISCSYFLWATCTQQVPRVQFWPIFQLWQPNAEPDYCIQLAQEGEAEVCMTYWYMLANAEVSLACRWHWTGSWVAGVSWFVFIMATPHIVRAGPANFKVMLGRHITLPISATKADAYCWSVVYNKNCFGCRGAYVGQ